MINVSQILCPENLPGHFPCLLTSEDDCGPRGEDVKPATQPFICKMATRVGGAVSWRAHSTADMGRVGQTSVKRLVWFWDTTHPRLISPQTNRGFLPLAKMSETNRDRR